MMPRTSWVEPPASNASRSLEMVPSGDCPLTLAERKMASAATFRTLGGKRIYTNPLWSSLQVLRHICTVTTGLCVFRTSAYFAVIYMDELLCSYAPTAVQPCP